MNVFKLNFENVLAAVTIAAGLYRYAATPLKRAWAARQSRQQKWRDTIREGIALIPGINEGMQTLASQLATHSGLVRLLCAEVPIILCECDANGGMIWGNAKWLEVTGLTVEQGRGAGWVNAIHEDDCDRLVEDFGDAVRGQYPYIGEFRYRNVRSRVVTKVHCEGVPVRTSTHDRTTGWLCRMQVVPE